jgi:hypothetical protein
MRDVDESLLNYVRLMAKAMGRGRRPELKYKSIADLLLREGTLGVSEFYTPEEEEEILNVLRGVGCRAKVKQCYYNAQSLAISGALGYAEGYVWMEGLPLAIEHAWSVLPSGKAVDFTLREHGAKDTSDPNKLLARAKENLARHAYLGLEIPADVVRKTWLKTETAINLLEYPDVQEVILLKGYPDSWRTVEKGPSLAGGRPEDEWLKEPEREGEFEEGDPTRSPYEGDIPPWGQAGYKGVFPMQKKVFYITAYIGTGPEGAGRSPSHIESPTPSPTPSLAGARPVRDVGTPPGKSFGTFYMYRPFAAVPVRHEDFSKSGTIVDYLAGIISELGVFGKILLEETFPSGADVRLENGRWFPVDASPMEYGGIQFLNAYDVNRIYGGAEEGGWWYDTGEPVASVPLRAEDELSEVEWKAYYQEKVAWSSKYDRFSVLGHDDFSMRVQGTFGHSFPEESPHYE